jgi:hypothetical protein
MIFYLSQLNKISSIMSHSSGSTGHSHKNTIEHFANAVNGNHFNDLNKYLDENVQKSVDSDVVYRNLKEAQDYYKKKSNISLENYSF